MTYIVITSFGYSCCNIYSRCFFFSLSIKIFIAGIASTGTDNVIVFIAQLYTFGFPTFLFIVQYYT